MIVEIGVETTNDGISQPHGGNIGDPESVNNVFMKLTTQEVGEGYFHILFTVIYAIYIGFALFHLHTNRFKLCIPCSIPQFHSKRMSMIIGYIMLIMTALFGFVFNLYLYESVLIDKDSFERNGCFTLKNQTQTNNKMKKETT